MLCISWLYAGKFFRKVPVPDPWTGIPFHFLDGAVLLNR